MSLVANLVLGFAKSIASVRGSKLKIDIGQNNNRISYKFEKPVKNSGSVWENYYQNAGLFIKHKTQEVQISDTSLEEKRLELTGKAKLEPVLKAQLGKQLWGFGQSSDRDKLVRYAILAGVGVLVIMGVQ